MAIKTIVTALLLTELVGGPLSAQDGNLERRGRGVVRWRHIEPVLPLAETMKNDFELRIEEINRVCDLTEGQLKKLRIAAKGAIDVWCFEDHDGAADDLRLQLTANALDNAGLVERKSNQNLTIALPENEAGRRALGDHPIWKATLRGVLTDEQDKMLKAERKRRRQYRVRAAIAQIVTVIDAQLLLSAEQRTQVADLMESEYRPLGAANWARQLVAIHEMIDVTRIAQIFPSESLQGILSKTQMKKWNMINNANQEVRAKWTIR